MDDMGVDEFRSKVEALLPSPFEPAKPFSFDTNIDSYGWHRDDTGRNHFLMFIENGRVEDTPDHAMKTGLRAIAMALQEGGEGEFRLTPNQHLCLSDLPDSGVPAIKQLLTQYGLDDPLHNSKLRLSSSACVAFPTCGLAMAESERYLPQLVTLLEPIMKKLGLENESLVLRMIGCPNGCARPWLAEVGLVGKSYGVYNLYLGGGFKGNRLNKLYRSNIEEKEIVEILEDLLGRWKEEGNKGEKFGDFVIRKDIIKETTEGKNFHEGVAEEESDEE
jgi:sulfite reductase (NADPH) hemoprotein beta-component